MTLTLRSIFVILLVLGVAVIGYVLFSQYVQNYQPCELCLLQRRPWGVLIVLAALGILRPSRPLLALIGVTLIVSAGIAGYHTGVEHKWWPGPSACTVGAAADSVDALRAQLKAASNVFCDQVSWTLFGLSMATYNFLVSLAAGIAALVTALRFRHV